MGHGHYFMFYVGKGHFYVGKGHFYVGKGHFYVGKGHFYVGKGHFYVGKGHCTTIFYTVLYYSVGHGMRLYLGVARSASLFGPGYCTLVKVQNFGEILVVYVGKDTVLCWHGMCLELPFFFFYCNIGVGWIPVPGVWYMWKQFCV